MEVRETHNPDPEPLYSSVPHEWLGLAVQDLLSGDTGTLMDVQAEPNQFGGRRDVAYIRQANGLEFTTPAAQMRRQQ
ncbi:hypothetical protein ACFQ7O_32970 [Streptomyces sp. NPDC056485]|uniref:hypothetical protein n=1 Tax=Streptomyces sp. NPDC056485 TaxID=3345834 RepID=UPI003678F1E5